MPSRIPIVKISRLNRSGLPEREVQDWDCVESLDLPLFETTLQHIKSHGRLPPDLFSKEDQNEVGPTTVPQSLVDDQHKKIQSWLESLSTDELPEGGEIRMCLLDGFLLYPNKSIGGPGYENTPRLHTLSQVLDLKLFVPCSRAQTIERRTKRTGYVTLEGFWEDPPGYVEDVVWPNFMRDHGYLCREVGDQGRLIVNEEKAREEGIVVAPGGGDASLEELLEWAIGVVAFKIR